MIKKTILFLFCAMLVVTSAHATAAPDRVGKLDLGVNVSGAIPTDGDVDSSVYVGGTLAYGINEWLALGVESGWASFSASDSGVTVDQDIVPVLGDIIIRIPTQSEVVPYGIIGLGAIFSDASTNVSNVEIDVDTSFAAKFGGGLDWFINPNWALNFEAAYVTSDTDGTVRSTATGASVSVSGESDYWTVGGGVKYLFA